VILGRKIVKEFGSPAVQILKGIELEIERGEFIAISGRSGSGKSTLLYILSTLDSASSGEIVIDERVIGAMSTDEIHTFRAHNVGFVFQFHYLLPELTSLENILLPARNFGLHDVKRDQAENLLEQFGIADKRHKTPSQMSGGEQQRVAIARALIMDPKYIFADEPTGNLDSKNGEIVMNLLTRINREQGATVILVTHEPEFSSMADREIYLVDGQVGERT
jgi:putative ABC transport system ATP-binding protein/lipoprotein-releasing system ATP-binding protein